MPKGEGKAPPFFKNMKKVVVVSVDSLVTEDLEYLMKMPHLQKAFSSSHVFRDILCVYPTLTYPCHATILTGKLPGEHGIIHNEEFCVGNTMRWLGKASDIKVDTIFDIASSFGLKTASISWPVTCGAKVDYLIGEVWPPAGNDWMKKYEAVNSIEGHKIFKRHVWDGCSFMNRDIDKLTMDASLDILETYRPDLMLLHLAELDCSRHNNGVDPEKNISAISHVGEELALIWDKLTTIFGKENFNLVILGDHGQLDRDHSFSIHKVLEDKGLCTFNENGDVVDYKVYFHSTGLSALVYIKGIGEEEAFDIINEIKKEYPGQLGEIFRKEEARGQYGLYGDFQFVVEAGEGTYLEKKPSLPLIKSITPGTFMKASHGHLPQKGMKPPFVVCGQVENNEEKKVSSLVDEASYILSLLGIDR